MAVDKITPNAEQTATTNPTTQAVIEVVAEEIVNVPSTEGDVFTVQFDDIARSIYVNPRVFTHADKKKDNTDNKLKGLNYWILTYNGKALTTMDEKFVKASELNDLYEIVLKRNGDYLELVNYTTLSGKLNAQTLHAQIKNHEFELKERVAINNKRIAYINSVDLSQMPAKQSLIDSLLGE